MQQNTFQAGLKDVVAAETKLSHTDGQQGQLILAGYQLEEIAAKISFEELVYLLWQGRLPKRAQLASFSQALTRRRQLPAAGQIIRSRAHYVGQRDLQWAPLAERA